MIKNSKLDMTNFFPQVLQVVPTNDYKVYAYFNDGSIRCIDVKPLIKPQTVFEQLSDIDIFKTKLAVINDTVAWDIGGNRDVQKCIDLDADTIFDSPIIDEEEVMKVILS